MKWVPMAVLAAGLICLSGSSWSQQQTNTSSTEQTMEALKKLKWRQTGNVKFEASSSTLTLPSGFVATTGHDAQKFSKLVNGTDDGAALEGVAIAPDDGLVYFQYTSEGYVSLDDWGEVDPKTIIQSVSENTEKSNSARLTQGISPLHVDGWITKPTLDRQNSRVYWSFSAHDEAGNKLINAVILQLGRSGFEKIVWAGDPVAFQQSGSFPLIMRSYSFDEGSRYTDHIQTDKVASYGIAGLVGAVIGVKLLKVGAAAGLLVLLKKFIIIPFLIAAGFFKKLVGVFRERSKPPNSNLPPSSEA